MKRILPRSRDLLVGLLAATAFLAPFAAFQFSSSFQGIYLSAASDETHYVAQVRDISEGWYLLPNTYLWEGRMGHSNLYLWLSLPLGIIFRVWPWHDVPSFVLFWKFVGIAGAVILVFRLVHFLRPSWSSGWKAAVAVGFPVLPALLGPAFFSRLADAVLMRGNWAEFLLWTRFTNPVVSGLLFLGVLLLWFRNAEAPKWWRTVTLGALCGVMAWLYIFFWMFLSILLGFWMLLTAARRRWSEARHAALAVGITAAIGFAYVWWVGIQTATYAEFEYLGPLLTHAPIFEWSVIAAVAIFLLFHVGLAFRSKQPWASSDWALAVLAVTMIAVPNQQVITGRSLEPHHFYFLTNLPIAGLLLLFTLARLAHLPSLPRVAKSAGWVLAALLLWVGVGIQAATVRNITPHYLDAQRLAPAFHWIDRQPHPFVVLADEDASEWIPMYTGADVYYAPHANTYTTTPRERSVHAWYVQTRLSGITDPKDTRSSFEEHREHMGSILFPSQYYRDRCGTRGCFSDSVMEDLLTGYQDFLSEDFSEQLRRYRVDAVLWDEAQDPSWALDQYPFLHKIQQWDNVSAWTVDQEHAL